MPTAADLDECSCYQEVANTSNASGLPPAYLHTSPQPEASNVAALAEKESEAAPEYQSRAEISGLEAARLKDLGPLFLSRREKNCLMKFVLVRCRSWRRSNTSAHI